MAPKARRGIQKIHAFQRRSANQSSHKCSPRRWSLLPSAHRTQHFLFFFFLSVSRVDGGSRAATIACPKLVGAAMKCSCWAYLIKHVLELVLRQGRALDVLDSAKLSRHPLTVLALDRRHPLLGQLVLDRRVLAQIHLCAHNQTRHPRTVVVYLGEPLLAHVLEGCGRGYGEAYEEHVRLGIRQGSQAVVVFLSGRIE
jgi:hypothetical protein